MWSFWNKDPTKDFPYDIIPGSSSSKQENRSIWQLHRAKRKSNGEAVSVFRFDCKPGREDQLERAKSAAKKLKTLRHPNILTFIDSMETNSCVCIVTESVTPVDDYLCSMTEYTSQQREFAISWGVHQVSKGLGFLINDCNLKHNNIFVGSIFVTSTGNWKIAGFEYVTPVTDTSYPNKNISNLDKYIPPEVSTGRLGINKYSFDSWGLGCLIHEVFNGEVSSSNGFKSPGKVPKSLSSFLSELLSQNPSKRPAPLDFIEKCRSPNGFMKNAFIDSMLFLDEIQIKDQTAKNRFFSNLDSQLENFPSDVCKNRILPSLISAFEFGDAGAAVLGPLFKISKLLEEEDYQKRIVPCIVKLFSSKDRATRAKLLQQSEFFVKHINNNIINTQVYPNVSQGFLDNNPTIREQTVKSMLHFAPKLNAVNLNEDLLKQFARIQSRDEEGGIRTNTVVCLAKIACYLQPGIRQNVLISAFLRSMRDPFPAARINGIMALSATQSFYSLKETANKVMPALCHLTMDPEKTVRDQAFKALKGFIGKLEKVSEDPSLAEQMEADLNSSGSDVTTTNATWASWAVSSLTSKFYRSSASSASVTRTTTTTSSANKPSSSTMGSAAQTQTFSKEKTLDTDVFGNIEKEDPAKTDGWDDEWDGDDNDDDEDDVLEDKPCTPSLSNQTKKESIEKKSGWDDWGSSWTDTTPTKLSTRRKSEVTEDSSSLPSETESRPRVVKGTKGPLKLGAQKISR